MTEMLTTTPEARAAREERIRAGVEDIYEELTDGQTRSLRMAELVYAAAERHPDLLPSRAAIDDERELLQKDKQGLEIDQGVFLAHVLAHPRCGPHLVHAMAQPKAEALERLEELRTTGSVDLASRASTATARSVSSRRRTTSSSTPRTTRRSPRSRRR